MEHNCLNPWNYINIEGNGNCNFCCSIYSPDTYFIGNILQQDFNDIWNGEKAKQFRKEILDGNYPHCNISFCKNTYKRFYDLFQGINNENPLEAPYPKIVQFSYDNTCAQKCVFCRDIIEGLSPEQKEKYDNIIDTQLIPMLQNAEKLILSGAGEVFDSEHSKTIIKKAIAKYDKLRLELFTNGVKLTPENLKNLGIEDRISMFRISVNASTRDTYKKIFRADNFDKVMKNLEYVSQIKKDGKLDEIILVFVINALNYKEMRDFVKIAKRIDAKISIAHKMDYAAFTNRIQDFAVFNPNHYLYNDFVKMLQDPIFKEPCCCLDFDYNLKPVSGIQIIKNFINTIKR